MSLVSVCPSSVPPYIHLSVHTSVLHTSIRTYIRPYVHPSVIIFSAPLGNKGELMQYPRCLSPSMRLFFVFEFASASVTSLTNVNTLRLGLFLTM